MIVYSQIELVYNPLQQIIKQKCKSWAQNVRLVNVNSILGCFLNVRICNIKWTAKCYICNVKYVPVDHFCIPTFQLIMTFLLQVKCGDSYIRGEIVCHYGKELNSSIIDPCKCTLLVVSGIAKINQTFQISYEAGKTFTDI